MRGIKRIGGSVLVVAALAGAAATPAVAAGPACSTRLAAADVGTSASCSFWSQYDYATISVAPVQGTLTATLQCWTQYGSSYTTSRTISKATTWSTYAPDSCTLRLTSQAPLTTANATASSTVGPIIQPYPVP